MSQRTGWAIGGLILIGALAAAASMVLLRPEPASRPPPSLVPFALTAPVEAGEGAIPVHAAGTVQPRAEVDVTAEVSGKVVWVDPAFESSGRVREGQPLFRIEDTDYRNRVQQARANVALQRVEVLKVEEEAAVARSQYERFRERQGSQANSDTPSPLALWEPQLQAARRALERDGAVLREAALNLARTEIRAPFDGIVRSESVDVGQYVAAGQSVGRLYASGSVEVVVPLSDDAAALLPGLWDLRAGEADTRIAARVIAEYGEGIYAWDGYLDRGAVTLDEQTRTIDVIVRVPKPFSSGSPVDGDPDSGTAPPLLVGKFVDVELQGLAPERYFKVPDAALRTGDEVWAVRDGKVNIVPVQVLQRSDNVVYVTGALEVNQPVVTGGVRLATEGMAVQTAAGGS
ncbi:MAG: efflux RND transporter periplasmic adaptor subunit [Holophagales bacterium]|nr:efflux RND transporter periplasmic adaptor subunit [Holophagales bacterium]MYH24723.1 efflux RND transporter periplasmic adaptor subunit [Holophagales bacterium]